jgi:hypothetical protein
MITRRFLLQSAAAAAAYSSQGFRPVWAAKCARHYRYRDQDRPDHAL